MVELKPFLVLQAYHLNDFRLPEIESIARALHIPFEQDQIDPDQHAFHTIRVPSAADAGRIVARSVLSRYAEILNLGCFLWVLKRVHFYFGHLFDHVHVFFCL